MADVNNLLEAEPAMEEVMQLLESEPSSVPAIVMMPGPDIPAVNSLQFLFPQANQKKPSV